MIADVLDAWAPFRDPRRPAFLVVDEIQRLADGDGSRSWASQLKGLVDLGEIQVLATGSAAGVLYTAGAEGAGRTTLFKIEPLDFTEFRSLRSPRSEPAVAGRFNDLERYLVLGGFPEYAGAQDTRLVLDRRSEYVDNVLRADLSRFNDHTTMARLFSVLMEQSGEELNLEALATVFGQRDTVRKWIDAMESVFLVSRVPAFASSRLREARKRPKVYAGDPGLVAAFAPVRDPLSDPRVRGRLFEAAVLRHLRELASRRGGHVCYVQRRSGKQKLGEADFVLEAEPTVYVIEATSASAKLAEKAQSTLAVAREIRGKASRFSEVRAAVVHGGANREETPIVCVPLADFLSRVLLETPDDPFAGLREMSSELRT